jgi:hypothetical protein
MKKTFLITFAGLAVSLLSASSVQATTVPMLTVSLQEDALTALTSNSTTGSVIMNNTNYGDFLLNNVTGLGAPLLSSPYLNLQTLNISMASLNANHTLTIMLTETGLTATTSSLPLTSAFTGILSGVSSETVTSYYDASNAQFGTAHMLNTSTFTAMSNNSTQVSNENIANLSNPFSETEIMVATFSAGSMDSLNSSAVIQAGTSTPEPASCALIGGGLLGVALIRRRRRSTN